MVARSTVATGSTLPDDDLVQEAMGIFVRSSRNDPVRRLNRPNRNGDQSYRDQPRREEARSQQAFGHESAAQRKGERWRRAGDRIGTTVPPAAIRSTAKLDHLITFLWALRQLAQILRSAH